jgi:membrane associated rhomboid family serine protease
MADDPESDDYAFFRKKLLLSMMIPGIFLFFMWIIRIVESLFGLNLVRLGIYPLEVRGISGIIFSPFIHGDFGHLFNNSLPFFFLSTALFYFYSDAAIKIFLINYFMTGVLVWLAGNSAWHIGASGIVYGLASFLFFSGIIRKYYRMVALSLLIVFLYGQMVWGIFPGVYQNISWESHMLGSFSGILLSIWFRNEGPQAPVHDWMEEEENQDKINNFGAR